MLSYIDPVLFPDHCEVLETAPGRHVYTIFKNGSSSLRKSGFRALTPEQISGLDVVDVYVREPFDRYVSGVQTYLKHLPQSWDRDTVLNMIDQFLFLNRHFALQFHWLVNFTRFSQARMRILPMDHMQDVTARHRNQKPRDPELVNRFQRNQKLQFYLGLDRTICDHFVNTTTTVPDIVAHIQDHDPALYQEVIQRDLDLCTALA